MIRSNRPFQNVDPFLVTDLPDDLPQSIANIFFENRFVVLRPPDEVIHGAIGSVSRMVILAIHVLILSLRESTESVALKCGGFLSKMKPKAPQPKAEAL